MSELIDPNDQATELGKVAVQESVSQGFKLLDKFLTRTFRKQQAIDWYFQSVQNDEGLTRDEKFAIMLNAKKTAKRLRNAASICEMSVEEGVTEQKLLAADPDWIDYFFEHAAAVSREDMQRLWARILAQECDEPDSVPKALIHTLSIMGKKEAETYLHMASFCFVIHSADGRIQHRPLMYVHEIGKFQITLEELSALESIGLLQYGSGIVDSFVDGDVIEYFGKEIKASDLEKRTEIPTGSVLLSHTGEALMRIVAAEEAEGFFEKAVDPLFHGRKSEWGIDDTPT